MIHAELMMRRRALRLSLVLRSVRRRTRLRTGSPHLVRRSSPRPALRLRQTFTVASRRCRASMKKLRRLP